MVAKKQEQGLSDYELARQEKIAKNQALLKQLQLDAQQTGIGAKPKSTSTAGQKRKKPQEKKVKEEAAAPRRSSRRLQGIVADSEIARQKQEEEAEAFQEHQRAKRMRVSDDINLDDAIVNGRTWNRAGNWLTAVGPANPGERTFDQQDVKDTTDKELRELRERMSSLQLWEGAEPSRIKITPERIYSLGLHPTKDKALVFAGDKLGSLGLFDGSQTAPGEIKQEANDEDEDGDEDFEPAISTFKIHTRTISAFQFAPHDQNAVFSASYDSSIRKLDLAAGKAIEVYAPEDKAADEPISGVEISRMDPNMLHFATLNGQFGIKDMRMPSHQCTELLQLSEKKIGGFSLHPAQPHLVATASLDRTMKLFDLRKISGKGENRMPSLIGEHGSSLSVSHAAFNAAGQVATASYDDTVKIYDFSSLTDTKPGVQLTEAEMEPTAVIPHNNQTGRWVTILRAQWQMQPRDGIQRFAIGNMNRFVDIYTSKGQQLAQLGGEGITAVPAVARFHDSMDWVAAGTASGKLCLWQ